MISWLEKDTRMQYRIKLLLAWKKQAESENNKWAANTASKHIMDLQRKTYV